MTDFLIPFACWGSDASAAASNVHSNKKPVIDYNHTTLFRAIEKGNWSAAIALLNKDSAEARHWVDYQGVAGVNSFLRLPIHEACMHQPTEAVISVLITSHPQGVREKDSDGQLPLHHAVATGASLAVIEELLMECPDALDVKNSWGNFPLDIASSSNFPNSREVIAALRKRPTYYATKKYSDKDKMLKLTIQELTNELYRMRTENKELVKEKEATEDKAEQLMQETEAYKSKADELAQENQEYKTWADELTLQNEAYRNKEMQLFHILQKGK